MSCLFTTNAKLIEHVFGVLYEKAVSPETTKTSTANETRQIFINVRHFTTRIYLYIAYTFYKLGPKTNCGFLQVPRVTL